MACARGCEAPIYCWTSPWVANCAGSRGGFGGTRSPRPDARGRAGSGDGCRPRRRRGSRSLSPSSRRSSAPRRARPRPHPRGSTCDRSAGGRPASGRTRDEGMFRRAEADQRANDQAHVTRQHTGPTREVRDEPGVLSRLVVRREGGDGSRDRGIAQAVTLARRATREGPRHRRLGDTSRPPLHLRRSRRPIEGAGTPRVAGADSRHVVAAPHHRDGSSRAQPLASSTEAAHVGAG